MRIEFNKTLAFTSEVEGAQTLKKEWPDGRRPGWDVTEAKERGGSKWRRELTGPSMMGTEKYP